MAMGNGYRVVRGCTFSLVILGLELMAMMVCEERGQRTTGARPNERLPFPTISLISPITPPLKGDSQRNSFHKTRGGTSPFTLDEPLPFLDSLLGSWACRGCRWEEEPLKVVVWLMDAFDHQARDIVATR